MPLSTTQYGYIIDPLVPLTDDTGRTISNGYVRVFMAGTSTPVITYKNFDGATNEETVQLDNSGRTAYPVIGSKGSTYKVCVYDAEHSQESPILTIDKVVPAGANVEATNIVTGLDNVESPEAGWVKSTVSGTDAEVSLDATNVTSEVDTMVKATAASADYMVPLVHKAGSDPDKKITLGNIFKFALDNIVNLATTITSFASGDYFVVGRSEGAVKMSKDSLLTETSQNALAGNVAPAFDESGNTTYPAGAPVSRGGKIYTFKVNHSGAWSSSDVEACPDLMFKALTRQIFDGSANNIADLNDVPVNSFLLIQKTTNTTTLHFPTDYPNGTLGFLQTVKGIYSGSTYQTCQFLFNFTNKILYRRSYNSGNNTWGNWSTIQLSVKEDFENVSFVSKNQIFDGYANNLDSLDNAADNTVYGIQRTANTQTLNFPSDYPVSGGGVGYLMNFKSYYDGTHYTKFQVLLRIGAGGVSATLYRRNYNSGNNTWGAWATLPLVLASDIENAAFVSKNQIFDGYGYNLDDLNNAADNTSYLIARTANTTTLNFPPQYPVSGGGTGLLTTYKAYYDGTHYQKYQILERFGAGGVSTTIYRRAYNSGNNTWGAWTTHELQENVIKVGAGQQYTTLRAAFEAAYSTTNAEILVMPGTYDLTSEFSDILSSITTDVGLPIGNGMHVVFCDGAKVTANFVKGDLTDAQWYNLRTYFAPIWCRAGDFTIENMTIEATDCRYCVHDERGNNSTPYTHKFINCKMKKSSTTSDRVYAQCIGGGLGSHGTIVVDGGYYESDPTYGIAAIDGGEPTSAQMCISYHNDGYDSNAESSVTIKNVYFANRGYTTIYNYGTTTKKTMLYVSGCSLGLPPLKTGANNTATTDNTDIVQWCNDVRNNEHWEDLSNYQVDLVSDT